MSQIVRTPASRGAALTLAVLLALAGIVLLVWPGATTIVLVWILGVSVIAYGVREFVLAVTGTAEGSRVWGIVIGIVALLGGATILFTPLLGTIAVGLVIGWYWIAGGLVGIVGAFAEPGHRLVRAFLAVLSLVAGVLVVAQPGLSVVALVWFAGFWLIASGVIMVLDAIVGGRRRVAAA